MVKKLKDLDDVLTDICGIASNQGIPLWVLPIHLDIWVDTHLKFCTPIMGKLELNFHGTALCRARVFEILKKVNEVTPITIITISGRVFHVTKTEEFANKRCEAY